MLQVEAGRLGIPGVMGPKARNGMGWDWQRGRSLWGIAIIVYNVRSNANGIFRGLYIGYQVL